MEFPWIVFRKLKVVKQAEVQRQIPLPPHHPPNSAAHAGLNCHDVAIITHMNDYAQNKQANSSIPTWLAFLAFINTNIWHIEHKCTNVFWHHAPFSFMVIILCSDFKVILSQWFQSILSCQKNACFGCIHSHRTIGILLHTSKWSETNVVCSHIFNSLGVIWPVPVQSQRRLAFV